MSGAVHGGVQPIGGAAVKLYAVGNTGYGSAGTLLASTTSTTGSGAFNFTQVTNGATGPTGSSYVCPTAASQLYVISNGGNTVGTGTNNNTAAAFIAAIGPCGTSASAFIDLNEISTAGTVYALSQYMNPGTAPGTETMGTSGTPLAATGYANAYATIANLSNIATGAVVTPPTYSGTGTAAGVVVTATAESAKINTIGNILASCVNNASASNNNCADLFASATPPTSASVTSQPNATFPTAQDTVQAAYYLAINPANNGPFTSCNNGGTTKTSCLYGLVPSPAPFQPGLTTQPTDWTVGVTFSSTGTCSGGGAFIIGAYHAAIDGAGNVWFINGGSTTANLSEMSPQGLPMTCTGLLSNGRGMTIDANNNVWGSFNGTATNGVIELVGGTGTPIVWPISAGAQSYEMTSDGFGNVFYNQNAAGGYLFEFVNPGTTTTPFAPIQAAGPFDGTTTITQGALQVDPQGRIWNATSTVQELIEVYPRTQANITAYQVAGGMVTFTAANSLASGSQVQVFGLTTSEGATLNNQTFTVTSASGTTFSAATTAPTIPLTADTGTANQVGSYSFALLPGPAASLYGVAIDASNYIYQGTTCCGTSGTLYREPVKWTPGATGTAAYTINTTPDIAGINGVRSVAVDGAANVFVGNEYPNSVGATATTGTYSISEFTSSGSGTTATFTALSPTGSTPSCSTTNGCPTGGGFFDNDFNEAFDLQVDPSGNLWVMNSGTAASTTSGTTITELVGAAVPVVTPLSIGLKTNTFNTKP